ncbi:MAG: CRISPR-associated ring nuclease Crn3/Csx3 [Thermofilum sp.]
MTTGIDWLRIEGCTIEFQLTPTQTITPEILPKVVEAVYKAFVGQKCQIIKVTGRGPIWLYSAVVHAVAHLTPAVAVFDAVGKRFVIVVSHAPEYKVGQVIE